ncbi:MAG: hypothetical protein HC923_03990 [Myxococcales bacterium]|nr:hypothetical protein [Myxococcales bacterium]
MELQHAFETMTLTVFVTGRASDPDIRFAGEPAQYDQATLLSFFAGIANPDDQGSGGPTPEEAAGGAAAGILLGPVTKKVRQTLPIDTFDVGMSQGAPVVTVGKWLTETVFLAYRWNMETADTEQEYQGVLRWRFFPSWMLEVVAGLNTQSADVFWVQRF